MRYVRDWRWIAPVVCFVLVGLCWALSTPPAAGVDEGSHYVRMIGMTQGGLIGGPVPADTQFPGQHGEQLARVVEESGMFEVPGDVPVPYACNVADPAQPYNCPAPVPTTGTTRLDVSYHAHYLPAAYVLPAALSAMGTTTWRALVLGRVGFLLQDAALLAVAALALRRAVVRWSSTALGTLLLCATPLLLFQSGTLAPNGTEIIASVAFMACLVAALRTRSRGWWWLTAAVGALTCWTRDLGTIEVAIVGSAVLLADPAGARWVWSRRRSVDAFAAVGLVAAGIGATVWQWVLKVPLHPRVEQPSVLWGDFRYTLTLLRDSIGLLGWLNVPINPLIEGAWAVAWVVGMLVLFVRAGRRTRLVALGLGIVYVVANLAMISGMRNAGFGAQSRFTLAVPIATAVLLAVDQPTARSRSRWWSTWPLALASMIAAAGQLAGLLVSAQHNATGLGVPMQFGDVVWSPPGGWPLALTGFVVACGSILVLAPLAIRNRVRPIS